MNVTNENLLKCATKVVADMKKKKRTGKVADYIPELAKVSPDYFGISFCTDKVIGEGDCKTFFTMQSVSKVLLLAFALETIGEKVFDTVDYEASSEAFNSVVKLELVPDGRPMNPFINAGAIAVSSLIVNEFKEKALEKFLGFINKLHSQERAVVDEKVYKSEKATASRNYALAYFMESRNVLKSSVEDALVLYFSACSINTNTNMLAEIASVFAQGGKGLISRETCKIVVALMGVCGLYNGSGGFAIRTGLPAKSGVCGGILAVVPGQMGMAVFSPPLDKTGNSVLGVDAIEAISEQFKLRGF